MKWPLLHKARDAQGLDSRPCVCSPPRRPGMGKDAPMEWGGVGWDSVVIAISVNSHGKHFIPGSRNSEQSVSGNNRVQQQRCFSRGKLLFSRCEPQRPEGVEGQAIRPRNNKRRVPYAQCTCLPRQEKKGSWVTAEGSTKCSAWSRVGCLSRPPFLCGPDPFLRAICDFWCTHVPWIAKAGQQLSP